MLLRHRDLDPLQAQLGTAAGHIPRHRHLRQHRAVLGDQPLPGVCGRCAAACGARPGQPAATRRSAPHKDQSLAGAYADTSSSASALRLPARLAHRPAVHMMLLHQSRIDSPLARRSRLICSNSSTRDRATFDLCADNTDAKIRTRVGPIFATTHAAPPPGAITTQAGPQFATNDEPAGASQVITFTGAAPEPGGGLRIDFDATISIAHSEKRTRRLPRRSSASTHAGVLGPGLRWRVGMRWPDCCARATRPATPPPIMRRRWRNCRSTTGHGAATLTRRGCWPGWTPPGPPTCSPPPAARNARTPAPSSC